MASMTSRMRHIQSNEREREAKARQYADRQFEIDSVMERYREAYRAVHGVDIVLTYTSGWVRSRQFTTPYRLADLSKLTDNLWARLHEQELGQ